MAKKRKKKGKGKKPPVPDKGDQLTLKSSAKKEQETEASEYEEVRPKG